MTLTLPAPWLCQECRTKQWLWIPIAHEPAGTSYRVECTGCRQLMGYWSPAESTDAERRGDAANRPLTTDH